MNKILFETKRTQVREFQLSDKKDVFTLNSNELVTKYTSDVGRVKTEQDAENIIEQTWISQYKKYGFSRWAVVCKQTNKVIGFAGFKYLPEREEIDFGYRFLPDYWGQGLGFEVAFDTLEFGLSKFKFEQVHAMAMPENQGSNRILEKLGFAYQGQDNYQGVPVKCWLLKGECVKGGRQSGVLAK